MGSQPNQLQQIQQLLVKRLEADISRYEDHAEIIYASQKVILDKFLQDLKANRMSSWQAIRAYEKMISALTKQERNQFVLLDRVERFFRGLETREDDAIN